MIVKKRQINKNTINLTKTKGFAADAKGFAAQTKGFEADAKGFAAETKGFAADAKGFAAETKGFVRQKESHCRLLSLCHSEGTALYG